VRLEGKSGQLDIPTFSDGFYGRVSANRARRWDFACEACVCRVCDVGPEGAYAEKIASRQPIVAKKPTACPRRLPRTGAGGWKADLQSRRPEMKAGETILMREARACRQFCLRGDEISALA